jgi:hypothetical protein
MHIVFDLLWASIANEIFAAAAISTPLSRVRGFRVHPADGTHTRKKNKNISDG